MDTQSAASGGTEYRPGLSQSEVVKTYNHMVETTARKAYAKSFLKAKLDYEDYYSVALETLLDAYYKYDEGDVYPWKQTLRVKMNSRILDLNRVHSYHTRNGNQREPIADLRWGVEVGNGALLDELVGASDVGTEEKIDTVKLKTILDSIADDRQKAILYAWAEGQYLQEIAKAWGITESRVCQVVKQVQRMLREALQ